MSTGKTCEHAFGVRSYITFTPKLPKGFLSFMLTRNMSEIFSIGERLLNGHLPPNGHYNRYPYNVYEAFLQYDA